MELIKHDPKEFGGVQSTLMTGEELAQRLCCAAYCAQPGFAQTLLSSWGAFKRMEGEAAVVLSGYTYRTICRRHFVILALVQAHSLGDPLPLDAGREAAAAAGIDWSEIYAARPTPSPVKPEEFLCLRCGGIMMAETILMKTGRRWIHNCE